jgi:Ca2+-binding RTX toxin-like protein
VAADILALPEFAQKYGTLTNAAFVNQIFLNALGRAPTSAESTFWTGALNANKVSRADLLDGIAQSSEHLAISGASVGGTWDDIIYSRDGADTIDGGAGVDLVDYRALAMPGVSVDLAAGIAVQANGSTDTLSNIENVWGGRAADRLAGNAGANSLTGEGGSDTFAFRGVFGADVVTDFESAGLAHDLIEFDVGAFATVNAALAASQQVGADVVITAGNGSVTLKDLSLSSLTTDHFRIAA